ncbi:MAG: hypothetical protein WCS49_01585 [Bacilli bacterium]
MKYITKVVGLTILCGGLALTSCGEQVATYDPYTDYDTSAAFLVGTFANRLFPTDWTYVPDNPEYPNPSWCKSAEPYELKFKLIGMGVISPTFTEHDDITVAICVESIGKINETNTGNGSEHIFQVDAYDKEGAVLQTIYGDDVSSYHVTEVNFSVDNIAQIGVTMVGYYTSNSQKQALGICKIAMYGEESDIPVNSSFTIDYQNTGSANLPTSWNDTDTAETSRIGTFDVDGTEFKVNFLGKWRVSTNHAEIGAKSADPVSFLLSVSDVQVSAITIDYYGTETCAVYATNDASGSALAGVSQAASSNENSLVYSYTVNSDNWSVAMTSDAWIYSITFLLG